MRIRFHRAGRSRQEVGVGRLRTRCRPVRTVQRPARQAAPSPISTIRAVDLDLGSHNALFIRGTGGGLRWDKGQPLSCIAPGIWVWSAASCVGPVEFRLLLNDHVWARGEPMVLEPGTTVEVTPDFEWPDIPKVC